MKDLYLIYVNYVGKDYKSNYIYEFIFSDKIKNVEGPNWDQVPASGIPSPPHENFIKWVGTLTSFLKLDVIQKSDTFAIFDAVDGVIALAWQNINAYDSYPEHRLSFKFGEHLKDVTDKLYELDLILKPNYKTNEEQQSK